MLTPKTGDNLAVSETTTMELPGSGVFDVSVTMLYTKPRLKLYHYHKYNVLIYFNTTVPSKSFTLLGIMLLCGLEQ